jgi:hypothetical protein
MLRFDNRHRTVSVRVGRVTVGGGSPIVVHSMTKTDTVGPGRERCGAGVCGGKAQG